MIYALVVALVIGGQPVARVPAIFTTLNECVVALDNVQPGGFAECKPVSAPLQFNITSL